MPLSEEIELARYRDKRIAIDGAGWLYRGCYACARDLALVELGLVPKGSRSDPMASKEPPFVRYVLARLRALRDRRVRATSSSTAAAEAEGGDRASRGRDRDAALAKGKRSARGGARAPPGAPAPAARARRRDGVRRRPVKPARAIAARVARAVEAQAENLGATVVVAPCGRTRSSRGNARSARRPRAAATRCDGGLGRARVRGRARRARRAAPPCSSSRTTTGARGSCGCGPRLRRRRRRRAR